jgi:hypothetical protein
MGYMLWSIDFNFFIKWSTYVDILGDNSDQVILTVKYT